MKDAGFDSGFSPQRGDLVTKGEDFEIYRGQAGTFEVLRLHGKCTPKLLTLLRDRHFKLVRNLAIDVGSLSDAGYPFSRDLVIVAKRFRSGGRYLVLLNARGQIREIVRTSAPDGLIQLVNSERLLEGDINQFMKRLVDVRREMTLIRSEIANNPAWQLVDREQIWLCPYCGSFQDLLRFNPKQAPPDALVEAIWSHLGDECPDHRAGNPVREMTELSEALRKANQDKLSASRTTATALASRVRELQGQVQEVEESVMVAAERQRYLLPSKPPEVPDVISALGYWPAKSVSGDFYDFLDLGESRYAFTIGDVSGHGIEAAILMGVAKKVVNIRIRDTSDPAVALQMANRDIYPDLDRRTFVSVMLGVLDTESREFTYVRAGHNPAILYNPDRSPQFTKLEAPGLVLGLDSGARFNTVMVRETVRLRGGDSLFFYTDGLVEAANRAGEEFGLQRVYDRMKRHHDTSPEDVIQGLYSDVTAFSEGLPQEDDVTAFLLRFY